MPLAPPFPQPIPGRLCSRGVRSQPEGLPEPMDSSEPPPAPYAPTIRPDAQPVNQSIDRDQGVGHGHHVNPDWIHFEWSDHLGPLLIRRFGCTRGRCPHSAAR